MGQYYKIVNLDKREYLHPHNFGDGAKLWEFGSSGMGTMFGLALLLANGNGQGGGDFQVRRPEDLELVGRWAGDRIVVVGDYANEWPGEGDLYMRCALGEGGFKDISEELLGMMLQDSWYRESVMENPGYLMRKELEKLGFLPGGEG